MLETRNSTSGLPELHVVSDLDEVILAHDRLFFSIFENMTGTIENFFESVDIGTKDIWTPGNNRLLQYISEAKIIELASHLSYDIEPHETLPKQDNVGREQLMALSLK